MKLITILVPVYNEEAALPFFYRELTHELEPLTDRYDFEILFVSDGSTDGSMDIVRELRVSDPRVNYLELSRNFGKEVAMLAGMDYAKGDALVIIDADLQEPPSAIKKMIDLWEQGYDDVYGLRRERNQQAGKRISSKLFHKLIARLSDVDLNDDAGDFRLLDRKCYTALRSIRESQRYTKGMYPWVGFRKASVDIAINPRVAGKTKWSTRKLMHLAADGIMSHSVVPLRLASYTGMIVSLIAFIFLIYVVMKALLYGDRVAGYPSLMAVMLFLGGFLLLALGIAGEYIGRIYLEVKRRPVYFAANYNGGDPTINDHGK